MSTIKNKHVIEIAKVGNVTLLVSSAAKHHPLYKKFRDRLDMHTTMLTVALGHLCKVADIPASRELQIILKPIKGNTDGWHYYRETSTLIELDFRLWPTALFETLMHELRHEHQILVGRYDARNHFWDGQRVASKATTYKAYCNLPWEIDAFGNQRRMAKELWDAMQPQLANIVNRSPSLALKVSQYAIR